MINIRKMEEKDRAEVVRMMGFFYASPAVSTNGSKEIFNSSIDECLSDSVFLDGYCLEYDSKLAGYAMIAHSFCTEFGKSCVWIEDVFVIPEFRKKGIASAFIDFVREQNPDSVIRLEVEKFNVPAIKVYQSKNFEKFPYSELYSL